VELEREELEDFIVFCNKYELRVKI